MRLDRSESWMRLGALALPLLSVALLSPVATAAKQTAINGPVGSGSYGKRVVILPNGNLVVTDPDWNTVGAVYLLRPDGSQISVVTGGTPNDSVGSGGITVLPNGNFLINSGSWQNAGAFSSGAVTFVDGRTGLNGVVSAANSLVGSGVNDSVGQVVVLANGHYVVVSQNATVGGVVNAGAVTWGSGLTGVSGTLSAANSLVGSSTGDRVGQGNGIGVVALAQGHYAVPSRDWDNSTTGLADVGAVTWCNGSGGCVGPVSGANSLTGSQALDQVGFSALGLPNGNYVVSSPQWANGSVPEAGAVTWCNGTSGCTGLVGIGNSLVGDNPGDHVGDAIRALANNNYVVLSQRWNDAAAPSAGAVTWGNGATGTAGVVDAGNSIVGGTQDERVGDMFLALSSGHYLVGTRNWDNGAEIDAGAVRWANGTGGSNGIMTVANALVGTKAGDFTQSALIEVGNGNYLLLAPQWDNGPATAAGAATWGNGVSGSTGEISAANALVGVRTNDTVGSGAVRLANGNYVVRSPGLSTAATSAIGAVTWGNGSTGTSGIVSSINSLVGVRANDRVGGNTLVALANGHYMFASTTWNSATNTSVGAVTWGNGNVGTIGEVTDLNSLTGSRNNDNVGSVLTPLPNSRILVGSGSWDNGMQTNTGAFTLLEGNTPIAGFSVAAGNSFIGTASENRVGNTGATIAGDNRILARLTLWDTGSAPLDTGAVCLLDGNAPLIGIVNASDCVLGLVAGGGTSMNVAYELAHQVLVVGIPSENKIVIFGNRLLRDGFE